MRLAIYLAGSLILAGCGSDPATHSNAEALRVDVRGAVAVRYPDGLTTEPGWGSDFWCEAHSGLHAGMQVLVLDARNRRLGVGELSAPITNPATGECVSIWLVDDLLLDDGVLAYKVTGQRPVYFTRDEAESGPLRLTLTP